VTNLVYDIEQRRPGCVLLQATMGGSISAASRFPTESWLLAPTDGMRRVACTDDELAILTDLAWLRFTGGHDPMLAVVKKPVARRRK
jgi:hypothetical protein